MTRRFLIGLLAALPLFGAEAPRRIVSLSPNVTEMLYGIGAFGQVVGVSDFCTYPPAATKLPSVGGWTNPSLEKLAALHPDLVIIDTGETLFVGDNFKKLGLNVMAAADHTIQDVYTTMAALGRATGHDAEAARLIASTREGLARVSQKTAPLGKPKVVLVVDRTPGTLRDLYTATGGFLIELVDIAGGRMALSPTRQGYEKLSKEDLLATNPDYILDFIHGVKSRFAGPPLEAWQEMSELKAVRGGHICGVNEDYVPHASQRMVQTAELFARLLHPEAP
jgi:iron complex transport system substrate-binding protein